MAWIHRLSRKSIKAASLASVHESFPVSYSAAMSTKHIRTVADLVRFGAGLRVECGDCGSARTLDGFEAAKLVGSAKLTGLGRRLRCARCGAKAARLMILPPV